jgi:MoxR-like ATPase
LEEPVEELPQPRASQLVTALLDNISSALRGKPDVVVRALVCLVARGHLLIEDVPGVGKTTLARSLAQSVDADFNRIQFTSDMLPGDLTGFAIPEASGDQTSSRFRFHPGPLFANVVLADEVNRASPKCQSALLEAMSDRTVSVDGVTHALPDPFLVVATQNPLEHFGTHPLPESQLDRFLMRVAIGYPSREYETEVLLEDPSVGTLASLEAVVTLDELRSLQRLAERVKFGDSLASYLLEIVEQSRDHESLELGVSPRGAIALRRAAQARALIDGRDYCIPEDIRELALDVFSHRVCASARAGALPGAEEHRWVLREILDQVPVPL